MKECKIDGCQRKVRGRGLCGIHYMRWYRHGDPQKTRKPRSGCGTTGGYAAHRRDGTPPCQPCKDARNEYNKERNAIRRGRTTEPPTIYAGTCTECDRPMVKRRTPKDQIPEGHIRARNKRICVGCEWDTRADYVGGAEEQLTEYMARQQARAKAMDPALAALMRGREERLAREARRKRAAQILANQGRRPAA